MPKKCSYWEGGRTRSLEGTRFIGALCCLVMRKTMKIAFDDIGCGDGKITAEKPYQPCMLFPPF
jgi:hypothetical protein